MRKSVDFINETIRHAKHMLYKGDTHTNKPLRHRYERRKIRGYLTQTDLLLGDAEPA